MLAREDAGEVACCDDVSRTSLANCDEVWVHGMWLPKEWRACRLALNAGKALVRMTHGSLSPIYLEHQGKWKKRLVGPIERWLLRRCNRIVATCEAEREWIAAYVGKGCPPIEVTDIRRFFNLAADGSRSRTTDRSGLHVLYLGRRHPLKGVQFLERAVEDVKVRFPAGIELRVVSDAFGEEKEKVWNWCDVLVLPTLSENFGLVVAEALEHGKRVIVTDGAPAWAPPAAEIGSDCGANLCLGYGGRLLYLKGYREGSDGIRVRLLKDALLHLGLS